MRRTGFLRVTILATLLLILLAAWGALAWYFLGVMQASRTEAALAVFQRLTQNQKYAFMGALMETEGMDSVARLLDAAQTPSAGGLTYRFGWDVYKKYGVDGITRCPASLMLGCRAGILRAALIEHGPSILPQFADACGRGKPGLGYSCGHGIGHGTAETTQFDVPKALAICDGLESYARVPCYGGVFQEYLEFAPATRFSESDRWQPCTGLEDKYRSVCAFTLPDLWNTRYGTDDTKAVAQCASSNDAMIRTNCMLGVGFRIVKEVKGDPALIVARCGALFPERSRPLCLIGASNVLGVYKYANWDTAMHTVCKGVSGELGEICKKAASTHTVFGTSALLTGFSF